VGVQVTLPVVGSTVTPVGLKLPTKL
jgi:hypothetical protein